MKTKVMWIKEYLDSCDILPEMQKAMDLAYKWLLKDHSYVSKNRRIAELRSNLSGDGSNDFYDIMCHILSACWINDNRVTYQAMIGYISGNIKCDAILDRIKCAAELIALAYQADLIVITRVSDKTMVINTPYKLGKPMPDFLDHEPEFFKPAPVTSNPILGNHFKQHDEDVCLDHINKMNSIPLTLDMRVIQNAKESTKADLSVPENKQNWDKFVEDSMKMYMHVFVEGNRFYLKHNMDTRGRCYCEGYYINYQGAEFKKAIVQLANKEVVQL